MIEDVKAAAALDTLEEFESGLLELERSLEQGEEARPLVHALFRIAHNLKSTLAILGLTETASLFHACESSLDRIRSGKATACRELLETLMASIDEGRRVLGSGVEDRGAAERLRQRLTSFGAEELSFSTFDTLVPIPEERVPRALAEKARSPGYDEPTEDLNDEGLDPIERFRHLDRQFASAQTMGEFYRLVIEQGRSLLDLDRMVLFLYDSPTRTKQGTWGINERGELVDESDYSDIVPLDDQFLLDNLKKTESPGHQRGSGTQLSRKAGGQGLDRHDLALAQRGGPRVDFRRQPFPEASHAAPPALALPALRRTGLQPPHAEAKQRGPRRDDNAAYRGG